VAKGHIAGAILTSSASGNRTAAGTAMRMRALASSSSADGLSELVRVEQRLAARLAAAREQAAALLEAARARAAAAGAGEPTLAAALASMREAATASKERRVAQIRQAGYHRRRHWEGIPDERLSAVASAMVAEVVAELTRTGHGGGAAARSPNRGG
jgi:hypothetical protein